MMSELDYKNVRTDLAKSTGLLGCVLVLGGDLLPPPAPPRPVPAPRKSRKKTKK